MHDTIFAAPRSLFAAWVWPQGGLYQILIDRLATADPQNCDDLTDYCGNSLAGSREELPYLE